MRSRGNCAPDSLGPLVRANCNTKYYNYYNYYGLGPLVQANWRQTAIYIATNCTAPRLLSDGYHPTARLVNNLTGQQQIPLDFWDLRNQEIDISLWSNSFANRGQIDNLFCKICLRSLFLGWCFSKAVRSQVLSIWRLTMEVVLTTGSLLSLP